MLLLIYIIDVSLLLSDFDFILVTIIDITYSTCIFLNNLIAVVVVLRLEIKYCLTSFSQQQL